MFKVGDEVLVKGAITDLHEGTDHPYFVAVNYDSVHWVSEDKIIPIGKTYVDGLNDAWQLADKLNNIPPTDIIELFGIDISREQVFKEISPQEALAKIEAYESEKAEIKVGDLVEYKNTLKAVVTRIENSDEVYVLWGDGSCGMVKKNEVPKNGETVEGFSELLRQIGE